MSYRELRDAVEILRFLQYPRLISIENFRNPNFPLMAEIVEWTVKKFDPNYRVPKNIDTEQNRVLFVKSCVLALVQKARVKINPKNLYQSDGYAVRELLPVLKLLYEGNKEKITDDSQNKAQLQVLRSQITGKRQEIRDCINKVLELPQQSANLYDLLAKELVAREARTKALSQSLNVRDVEKTLKTMVQHIREQYNDIENRMKNLGSDEKGLDEKIDRRERELDQLHKRLAKLQSFRPPHMDEFERQEARLQNLYNEYILQFRNLTYLNEKLLDVERAEREKSDEAERSMRMTVEKMKDDNKRLPQLSGAEMENVKQNVIKFYGNMTGAGVSDEEDEEDDYGDNLDDMKINELDDVDTTDDDAENDQRESLARRRERQRSSTNLWGENGNSTGITENIENEESQSLEKQEEVKKIEESNDSDDNF
ncbi:unnamed protein product [Bursaphelenchus xylophilus]|uniref:(pine wood nematode) hypothetical protein n=1 Tax=Bursaphelenchus xylophilus TaxID=6326 RepID=A0A7I8XD90_BURXY|nr:unnamed protein product [Bursaphelenchus xylophilus]CAG9113847.1 unnamed protein product [Bursaphelenchus xylophilus]